MAEEGYGRGGAMNCSGSSLVEEATAMLGGSPAAAAEGGEG